MQSNWSMAFYSTTQQINFFPDVNFYRIVTKTILRKFISRKSNDKVSWKCKKSHMWCVLQFGNICLFIKHKSIWGGTLILVKVAEWSAAFLELTLLPKWYKCPKSKTRYIFRLIQFVFLKSPENWNISRYAIWTEGESIISIFILHQFQQVSKSHFSLTLSLSWVSPNKQRKKD